MRSRVDVQVTALQPGHICDGSSTAIDAIGSSVGNATTAVHILLNVSYHTLVPGLDGRLCYYYTVNSVSTEAEMLCMLRPFSFIIARIETAQLKDEVKIPSIYLQFVLKGNVFSEIVSGVSVSLQDALVTYVTSQHVRDAQSSGDDCIGSVMTCPSHHGAEIRCTDFFTTVNTLYWDIVW